MNKACNQHIFIHVIFLFLLLPALSYAQSDLPLQKTPPSEMKTDLTELRLEDLMSIEVTSVSKKAQKLSDAPAAIFVVTQKDIRRSGATSIPEALRMVPGLQVARINTNKWAITSRGFNGRFANKLLVLIDGRSVYTPFFSGVYWDIQDTLLEDVERIEVIRGPGATLWGANAVNGVINILTRHPKNTQGGLVSSGIGTEERGFADARYGAKLDGNTYYRVYAKYFNRDNGVYPSGHDAKDDGDALRGGFRIDRQESNRNSLTLQGDIYNANAGQTATGALLSPPYTRTFDEDVETAGGNVLLRWEHTFSDSSASTFQIYYDRTEHEEVFYGENRNTFDIEFQHRFNWEKRHAIVWGLGYRFTNDTIENSFSASLYPDNRNDDLFSLFMQDDITLIQDRLRLMVGAKYEYNDYSGSEFQPNGRLLWTPDETHSFWAAISRAVRTPSRVEHDSRVNQLAIPPLGPGNPNPLPLVISLFGSDDYDSEELLAYELGYRIRLMDQLSLDIATFYNNYHNLLTAEPGNPLLEISPAQDHFVMPFFVANKMDGETYGVEAAADWQACDWWRLQAAYTYLQMQLHRDENSQSTMESAEGESPHHQFSLRSSMDLARDLEFDLWVRYVDNLPSQGIGSYIAFNARLAWKPREDLELSIVGQNLLDNQHPEFIPEFLDISATEVERSVYGKITWRF